VASQAPVILSATSAEAFTGMQITASELAGKIGGGSSILKSKLVESSSKRDFVEMDKLKQVLKTQNVFITNLLSKIDHLKLVSTLTKSPQVREAIVATIEAAETLDGNRKALTGAFNDAERVSRQVKQLAPEQHPTSLANQEAILSICQDIKTSIAKQQEDISELKILPAQIRPTYAQLARMRVSSSDQQGELKESAPLAEDSNWRVVEKKTKPKENKAKMVKEQNRSRKKNPLPDAIAVKPGNGETVTKILKAMRKDVDLETTGAQISSISESRNGMILIKLKAKEAERTALEEALKTKLGPRATVRGLVMFEDIEVQDLDCVTSEAEVENSIRSVLGLPADDETVKTRSIRQSFMGTQRAIVRLKGVDARKIVEKGRIKVGWVNARVRLKVKATKCFRCLGYGHTRHACKGPDRSEACSLCAKDDHKASSCNAPPRCVACQDIKEPTDHFPGSGKCVAYRMAMPGNKLDSKTKDRVAAKTGITLDNQRND